MTLSYLMMKLIYTILLATLFVPIALADELPDLGDVSATVLSPLQEKKIADQIMRDVMSSDEVVSDPEITDYIQNLVMRLASNGPDKTQWFNFFVVKDNSINTSISTCLCNFNLSTFFCKFFFKKLCY